MGELQTRGSFDAIRFLAYISTKRRDELFALFFVQCSENFQVRCPKEINSLKLTSLRNDIIHSHDHLRQSAQTQKQHSESDQFSK